MAAISARLGNESWRRVLGEGLGLRIRDFGVRFWLLSVWAKGWDESVKAGTGIL